MTDEEIKTILQNSHTIAMVGASDKPDRDSYQVMEYLLVHGYHVIPVNPTVEEIQGQRTYPSLNAITGKVDIVDIFRKPEAVGPVEVEALEINAPVIWMQLGVVNEEAAELARKAEIQVVMDRCIKVEHRRLIG